MVETDNPFELVLDRLREKGWMKSFPGYSKGPNCIIGAMSYMHIDRHEAQELLRTITRSEYGCDQIVYFNDHPDTTFADVERVLEKAAVRWEEERVLRDD